MKGISGAICRNAVWPCGRNSRGFRDHWESRQNRGHPFHPSLIFKIVFPRVTDQKKQRKDKPTHKENEAIEFEFNIGVDDCLEIAKNMYK